MPDPHRQPDQIWLISAEGIRSAELQSVLATKLSTLVKPLSFDSAIDLLEDGAEPELILLCGRPGKTAREQLTELKDGRPALPIFLVSHWEGAEEMRNWISTSVMEAIQPTRGLSTPEPANPYQLSKREIDVLRLMTRGLIKKEIGEQLSISYHTIVHHERSIYEKLNVHTRSAAVAKALMEKLC